MRRESNSFILCFLSVLLFNSNAGFRIKASRGQLEGYYRLRIGGYRIVYRILGGKVIQLEYADTRDVVYEAFRQLRMLGGMNE